MGKFEDYGAVTTLSDSDTILVGGTAGTRRITAKNAGLDLSGKASALQHGNIFGGRNLGSDITKYKAAIQNGTFEGLYIGDYFTNIAGYTLKLAHFNYFIHCGDADFNRNHAVFIVEGCGNSVMNDTNTTEGGCVGSKMYKETLPAIQAKLESALGSMLLSHRDYLINAMSNGKPSGGAWFDTKIGLMNEIMVTGCRHFAVANDGTTIPALYTTKNSQLALFRLNPGEIKNRQTYWLEDPVSAAGFAGVSNGGYADYGDASCSYAVRPFIVIG